MKRIFITFISILMCVFANADYHDEYPYIKTCLYKTNYWTDWTEYSSEIFCGSWSQITVCYYNFGNVNTSCFDFRLTIDNFSIPDERTREQHLNNGSWYEYSGTIEYWIDDEHMDFISCCNYTQLPSRAIPCKKHDNTPSIIKKSHAKIQIAPYESYPQTYNIWFEGVGFAFDMCGQHF